MPSGKTRVAVFALMGLTALLVGFHGASTLMTVTQIGASPTKPQQPKAHASLVPKPALPLQVAEPARTPASPTEAARKPASNPQAEQVVHTRSALPPAPDEAVTEPPASSRIATLAAATVAEAELLEGWATTEEPPPRRERPRRYRAPRPDLHRVY